MAVLSQKEDFKLRASKGWLKVSNFTPATGIGHFDAEYAPDANELVITVRLNFRFITEKEFQIEEQQKAAKAGKSNNVADLMQQPKDPPWKIEDCSRYKINFKRIAEAAWSRQYQFQSRKIEWSHLRASVRVVVETEAPRGNAHYKLRIVKGSGRSMVSHSPEWDGIFYETDTQPEVSTKRDQAAVLYAMNWLDSLTVKTECDFIPFEKKSTSLTSAAERRIGLFAVSGARYFNPKMESGGVKIYVYSQTGDGETFVKPSARSEAIAAKLRDYIRPHHGMVQIVSKFSKEPWIEKTIQRNLKARTKLTDKQISNRSFAGGMILVKNYATDVNLLAQVPTIPRDYLVSAHEFGHILGAVDEYMGVRCNALHNHISRSSPVIPGAVDISDARLTGQHVGISKLISAADVPAPFMSSGAGMVTESIMYAGTQVLPAHYLGLWEALLNITWPFLLAKDWRIVPEAPNTFKHMY